MRPAEQSDPAFEALLEFLRSNRGFDFTGYKRGSLERRIRKRMQEVGIGEFAAYVDYLELHPEEFTDLFNTILINVTRFFRDQPTWDRLRDDIAPELVARRGPTDPIRVWVAGCASGEEAYTIAIVLAEVLGEDQFHGRVKVFATDVDEEALAQARLATYREQALEGVPDELRGRYFEPSDGRFQVRKDVRRSVIFGRNDLVQDAPISRIDLLTCRNTLMYFNSETQARTLEHFHFALHDDGYLVLGKSEMILTHTDLFTPVEQKSRVFAKVTRPGGERPPGLRRIAEARPGGLLGAIPDLIMEWEPRARIVVDGGGDVVLINHLARRMFELSAEDVGRPLRDLEVSYRPVELRSMIDQAFEAESPVSDQSVAWKNHHGGERHIDIEVVPLLAEDGTRIGAGITFIDVTDHLLLQKEYQISKRDLETAYEELQSTVEELETTNEELQSTNEELETLNEELQSTNEELETTNEELQSTNAELESVNDEIGGRTTEVNKLNAFLESIMGGFRVGVVVMDRQLRVLEWNSQAEDLWGLRRDEVVGKPFLDLDIGLPMDQLGQPIQKTMAGEPQELVIEGNNRKGKPIVCRLTISKLRGPDDQVAGAIVVMEEEKV